MLQPRQQNGLYISKGEIRDSGLEQRLGQYFQANFKVETVPFRTVH